MNTTLCLDLNSLKFRNPLDKIKWEKGDCSNIESNITIGFIQANATASSCSNLILGKELVKATNITTTIKEKWEKIPRYSDYENLEELYDVDEIDELYYKASKKRGW